MIAYKIEKSNNVNIKNLEKYSLKLYQNCEFSSSRCYDFLIVAIPKLNIIDYYNYNQYYISNMCKSKNFYKDEYKFLINALYRKLIELTNYKEYI